MKTLRIFLCCSLVVVIAVFSSCEKLVPAAPGEDEVLDGPLAGLTQAELARFLRGDAAFSEVFTAERGLGPVFVTNSCISCHSGDGKGHPFTTLTRFGQSDSSGNPYLHLGGPQLQNRALPHFVPEQIPAGAPSSRFTPPAVTGLGFLSNVSDADILAMADPNDVNGDGISGVAGWIFLPDYITPKSDAIRNSGKYIGRFGKKAAAYDLLHQTVNAYNEDMGITSVYNPYDVHTLLEIDPEVSSQTIHDLVFYLETLKNPVALDQNSTDVQLGKQIFNQLQCASCHVPELRTGNADVSALANKKFYPYTDLLLHDMGPGLDDGYTEGGATSAEWRTPPLWGLRLSPDSQGGEFFLLHDGRAKSVTEAILLHGGEAENSKNLFQQLSASDKDALLKFLNTL